MRWSWGPRPFKLHIHRPPGTVPALLTEFHLTTIKPAASIHFNWKLPGVPEYLPYIYREAWHAIYSNFQYHSSVQWVGMFGRMRLGIDVVAVNPNGAGTQFSHCRWEIATTQCGIPHGIQARRPPHPHPTPALHPTPLNHLFQLFAESFKASL